MVTPRARFVLEAERSFLAFAELCRRHGVRRPTGHKWLNRYRAEGLAGLEDRSHRPHSCPHLTPEPVIERILEIRRNRGWGAPKIQRVLRDELSSAPSIAAIHRVLVQHEWVNHKKPRRKHTHPGPPLTSMDVPNATWTPDFKGEFRTGDSALCYPLPVQDGHSRFLLECHAMERLDIPQTRLRFEHLFRTSGLPERIRSDHGHPFASTALAGLSQRSLCGGSSLASCPN